MMNSISLRWSQRVLMWVMVGLLIWPGQWVAGATDNDSLLHEPIDIAGHWAEDVITEWMDHGRIKGYPDGSFRPDEPVTRAEMATLIGRQLDIPPDVSSIPFPDVEPGAWYTSGIAKLIELNAVSGYADGSFRPDREITRQEAAVLMAGIAGMIGDGAGVIDLFSDNLPVWSRPAVQAVQSFGWMAGDPAGTFRPQSTITRAEAVTALNKMFGQLSLQRGLVLHQAGSYGPDKGRVEIDHDVEVIASGVYLRQADVLGQLTVSEEVGEGDAELTNVRVEGKTFIRGGGINSLHLKGVRLTETEIAKETGKVRVVASDETTMEQLDINSPALFELDSGEIGLLVIGENAANTEISLAEGTVIRKLIVYGAPVAFRGPGTIEEAEIYAEPVTFERPPLSISCGKEAAFICSPMDSDDNSDGSDVSEHSDDHDESEQPQPTVTEVVYDPTSLVFESLGSVKSIELQAIWTNHSRSNVTADAVWSSEDEDVAAVHDGVVTSVGYGDTTARADYQGFTIRVPVSVAPTVTGLVYDPQSIQFEATGETAMIELKTVLSDGTTVDVTDAAVMIRFSVSLLGRNSHHGAS